jgi:hypothetical protein
MTSTFGAVFTHDILSAAEAEILTASRSGPIASGRQS